MMRQCSQRAPVSPKVSHPVVLGRRFASTDWPHLPVRHPDRLACPLAPEAWGKLEGHTERERAKGREDVVDCKAQQIAAINHACLTSIEANKFRHMKCERNHVADEVSSVGKFESP